MFESRSHSQEKSLLLIGVLSWLAVAFALITQHKFDMQPCAWCIFQRGIYLVIGLVALASWALMGLQSANVRSRTQWLASGLTSLLAMSGLGIALYQFFVASKVQSCVFTFAQKFLNSTGLDQLLPSVFMATASCADAAQAKLFGVPYELASAGGFLVLLVLSARAFIKR